MRQRQAARRLWPVLVASALGLITYGLFCPPNPLQVHLGGRPSGSSLDHHSKNGRPIGETVNFNKLDLSEKQCQVIFPGLTAEIELAVAEGNFELSLSDASSSLLGQIRGNKILVLRAPRPVDMSDQWIERQSAALHQLNRALLTSPTPLPDTVFNLYIQDTPVSNSWSHSRPAVSSSPRHIFPIPHFSFWAWNQPFIRSISHAAAATTAIEASLSFDRKDRRAVWRGTAWFNNGASANPRSRQELIMTTKNANWADVQALDWINNGENATNALMIEDFCRYKYIIHTEGVSYSGRLQFHQLCESVLLSPPIEWIQHTTHLIKPVYSSVLLGQTEAMNVEDGTAAKHQGEYPSSRAQEMWPATVAPEEATMVFVKPDWSDLEATISWLETHPKVARGIARRQRALFSERGYLSPAAEVCYWRSLIKGWGQVVHVDDTFTTNFEATSFEEFVVRSKRAQQRH